MFPGPRLSPEICSHTEAALLCAGDGARGPSVGCAPGREEVAAPRARESRVHLQASLTLGAQQKTLPVSVGCLASPH